MTTEDDFFRQEQRALSEYETAFREAFGDTPVRRARAVPERPCPGCKGLMRWEDVCCGRCWCRLPRGLRVEMLLERGAAAYGVLYARALKMLGASAEGLYGRKLPIEELESGRPSDRGAAGETFLRYPETKELLGPFFLLVLKGYAGGRDERRRARLIEELGKEALEKALAWDKAQAH